MKFAEHLSAHITPEWRKQYIQYEAFKEMLYAAQDQAPSIEVRFRFSFDNKRRVELNIRSAVYALQEMDKVRQYISGCSLPAICACRHVTLQLPVSERLAPFLLTDFEILGKQ
ncbi:hypothetical protein cypCar_00004099 [Cyprinus carpio]|nr:hypothetical protein cypCar_00004099 [Cyprinus carpio]